MTGARPRKRSLTLRGHPTSVSLEDAFWTAFREIAAERAVGPGSFAMHLIDALAGLDEAVLAARMG